MYEILIKNYDYFYNLNIILLRLDIFKNEIINFVYVIKLKSII